MTVLKMRGRETKDLEQLAESLAASLGIRRVTARVLATRGISSPEEARSFLFPSLRDNLPDPKTMKNIIAAAEMLIDSIESQEPVTIYSDYDVDGITSGAQLQMYLKSLGVCVDTYVTNRFVDGYGLSDASVRRITKGNTKILVTVDCGITNVAQIEYAKSKGIKVIILDHHEPGEELPPADVIVDPAQKDCPFHEHKLAAAGVVWMLLVVLRSLARTRNIEAGDPKDYLDLAAIGTICDMVPLRGVNRVIAHRGVEAVRKTKRLGVRALKEVAGFSVAKRFGAGNISFGIGPRINAAGRLGDAGQVLSLLTTEDKNVAKRVAEHIDKMNIERRNVENAVKDSCIEWIEALPERAESVAYAIYGENYHVGVIGIAAQRLVEKYHRPAAVLGPAEYEDRIIAKGSVRSIKGFHVSEALDQLDSLLMTHGGHESAGGFSIELENVEAFQKEFVSLAENALDAESLSRHVYVDAKVDFSEIDFDLVDQLSKLAPFGVGNPAPMLMSTQVEVVSASQLSTKHLRLRLKQGGDIRDGVAWNMFGNELLRKGKNLTIAYKVDINTYRGMSSVQLQVSDAWEA